MLFEMALTLPTLLGANLNLQETGKIMLISPINDTFSLQKGKMRLKLWVYRGDRPIFQ